MHSTYDILKDFAGPVAAIVGAFAAPIVALSLGRSQWRIAASQRDIALDKLKFDLF
jgi:predicted transcriptional regulator